MADVDANTRFGGFLTQMGINRRDNAVAQNRTWRITHMLLGDGGGRLPTPDPHATGLVNEVYRAPINHLYQDPDNPGILIVEMVIPPEIGGWWIRELGAEDEDGHFVAAANCPPSYKPQLPQGSTRDQTVRMRLITSHIDHIELKIDPSIVTASRAWVEVHVDERAATAAETEAGESERKFITPKILKPLLDTLDNAISTVAQALTQHRSSGDHDERYARRGQNLSDITNAGTARSNLGLGTMATRAAGTGGNSFRTNTQNDDRFVQQSRQISTGTGLNGGGNLSANRTLSLDNATITSLAAADSAVQPARAINAGTGLSGGGNLSANRTLSVDSSVVRTSRSIGTGSGLTGGGNLSANRTLSVDSSVVRTSGNQVIGGDKTFSGKIRANNGVSLTGDSSAGNTNTGIYRSTGSSTQVRICAGGRDVIVTDDTPNGDYRFIVYDEDGNSLLRIRPANSSSASAMRLDNFAENTSSQAPNVYVTGAGNFYRSTSSIRYKKDVETAQSEYYRKVLDLRPVFYRAKDTHDACLEWGYWGFIAEEVADIDPRLVHWSVPDQEDEWAQCTPEQRKSAAKPEGMQYERVTVLLQALARDHDNAIESLKSEIERLKSAIEGLKST